MIYTLLTLFFLTEKQIPKTFSLLECMRITQSSHHENLQIPADQDLSEVFLLQPQISPSVRPNNTNNKEKGPKIGK